MKGGGGGIWGALCTPFISAGHNSGLYNFNLYVYAKENDIDVHDINYLANDFMRCP